MADDTQESTPTEPEPTPASEPAPAVNDDFVELPEGPDVWVQET